MSDYFNCKLCDKTIKIKSMKKHLKSEYHKYLSMSIISRYTVTNPDFLHIENKLKNYVLDYNKKFEIYVIICKWKVHFSDTIVSVEDNPWISFSAGYYLRDSVLSKIKYYEKLGHKFSLLWEMKITYISDLRDSTYEHYLNQPKSMMEWKLNAILAKNPELIKVLGNSCHPLENFNILMKMMDKIKILYNLFQIILFK